MVCFLKNERIDLKIINNSIQYIYIKVPEEAQSSKLIRTEHDAM